MPRNSSFLMPKNGSRQNFNDIDHPPWDANKGGVGKKWRFATNISLYLRNNAKEGTLDLVVTKSEQIVVDI